MYNTEMSFDTHKHIKDFINAGMPELQAEAVVELVHRSRDYDLSKLATKDQIILLNQKIESSSKDLEQKIEFARAESKADISKIDQRISHIEEKMSTKDDLSKLENQVIKILNVLEIQMSRFETQIARQDSQQKSWMIGIFLSIAAMVVTLIVRASLEI
jgi:hypothetical protein